jgi:hypothetical protein
MIAVMRVSLQLRDFFIQLLAGVIAKLFAEAISGLRGDCFVVKNAPPNDNLFDNRHKAQVRDDLLGFGGNDPIEIGFDHA